MRNIAIIDYRMSDKCRKALENMGFSLVCVNKNENLDEPVSAHPDISVFVHKKDIVVESRVHPMFLEHLFSRGDGNYNLIKGQEFANDTRYPNDCIYNFAICGDKLIGNMKHISSELSYLADKHNLKRIDVKQGYAKCNICVVDENAIITEDNGIAKACGENGIDVLLLETNSVRLDGYKNGFIGGACGTVFTDNGKNVILFCGCIERHAEYTSIKNFCKIHGAEPISLSDEELYDYGSIIIL